MSDEPQDTTVDDTNDAPADQAKPDDKPDTGAELADLKAQLDAALKEADKHKALSRKHEGRAKENAEAASKARTVEERLAAAEKRLAEGEAAALESKGREAKTRVYARLAESGFNRADVDGLLSLIDPSTLLSDGEPDDGVIEKVAQSLVKAAGKFTPDRDQGIRGPSAPSDMNSLIRQAVSRRY